MNVPKKYFLFSLSLLLMLAVGTVSTEATPAWMQPRELSNFQTLLQHSPFSLGTAEDISPLSERYIVTGIVTLDGEEQIFVMDRNDQSREILTKKPNAKGMALVNTIRDNDPNKLKATIQVNGETGVINNSEPTENSTPSFKPGTPMSPYNRNASHLPVTPRYPGAGHIPSPQNPGIPFSNYNNRNIIRRPPISGPSSNQNSYQPGMPNSYRPPSYPTHPGTPGYPYNNYQPNMPSGHPSTNYNSHE